MEDPIEIEIAIGGSLRHAEGLHVLGVNRIELCANLGMKVDLHPHLVKARETVAATPPLPVYAMLRPTSRGTLHYSSKRTTPDASWILDMLAKAGELVVLWLVR